MQTTEGRVGRKQIRNGSFQLDLSCKKWLMLSEHRVVLGWGSLNVNIDITVVGQEGSDIADSGAADWGGTDLGTRDRWFLPFRKPFGGWVFVDTGRSAMVK